MAPQARSSPSPAHLPELPTPARVRSAGTPALPDRRGPSEGDPRTWAPGTADRRDVRRAPVNGGTGARHGRPVEPPHVRLRAANHRRRRPEAAGRHREQGARAGAQAVRATPAKRRDLSWYRLRGRRSLSGAAEVDEAIDADGSTSVRLHPTSGSCPLASATAPTRCCASTPSNVVAATSHEFTRRCSWARRREPAGAARPCAWAHSGSSAAVG